MLRRSMSALPRRAGGLLLLVMLIILVNLLTDITYGFLDPRIPSERRSAMSSEARRKSEGTPQRRFSGAASPG